MSADYGWLRSPDGKESARILFSAGANKDGYYKNILQQVEHAMDILSKYYPDEDHVLIYNNTTTHRKCADDALSATRMTKGPSENFHIDSLVYDADGNKLYDQHKQPLKQRIRMANAQFADGRVQELYFPDNLPVDHPDYDHRGKFKRIACLLQE
ncbi:hypothetical protein PQX77_010883 [Marasmius sp. AFHP31]|nr:hypothetical protein PQX77_010883 [Marasmius sp. AFHP31]